MVLRQVPRFIPIVPVLFTVIAAAAAGPKPPINTGSRGELAVHGYDVVAYRDGAAVRGSAAHEHRWNGAVWRFATDENRATFAGDPERFAPRFGGYCAWAVSRGYTADIDPQAFTVVDGRLYLNYSKSVRRQWEQDIPGNIARGDANWPAALNK